MSKKKEANIKSKEKRKDTKVVHKILSNKYNLT